MPGARTREVTRLTPEPLRTLRSETKGQAVACPDRTRAIPCTVHAVTGQPQAGTDSRRPGPHPTGPSRRPRPGATARTRTRRVGRRGRRRVAHLTRRATLRSTRRIAARVGGPGPGDRSRAGKQVIKGVTWRSAEQAEDPPAHLGGLGPDHPAGQGGDRRDTVHDRIGAPGPGERASAVVDDRFPSMQRPPAAGWPFTMVPGRHPHPRRAQRQHRGQRLGRGRQRPPVVFREPGDQRRVVDLAAVIGVIPVEPRRRRPRPRLTLIYEHWP